MRTECTISIEMEARATFGLLVISLLNVAGRCMGHSWEGAAGSWGSGPPARTEEYSCKHPSHMTGSIVLPGTLPGWDGKERLALHH